MPDWKAVVRTVAPALAGAFGGPLSGVVVKILSEKLLGKADGTEEEIATAVINGGTDVLLQIKQAEQEFLVKMEELGVRDRESARDLAKVDYLTPRTLAFGVTTGFFGILFWLLIYGFPEDGREPLLLMLGSLGTAWASIMAFYFGTTSGSARKTDILENLFKK